MNIADIVLAEHVIERLTAQGVGKNITYASIATARVTGLGVLQVGSLVTPMPKISVTWRQHAYVCSWHQEWRRG